MGMETINAADWGVLPGDGVSGGAPGGAAVHARKAGVRLRMEPGMRSLYPQGLPLHGGTSRTTMRAAGRRPGCLLRGFRDFTLDGGGSRWVFHAQMLPCAGRSQRRRAT